MAAGLAHELNNPAAAARRAAAQITEALDVINSAIALFVEAGVEREQAERLVALQQQALAHAAACTALDALDASDAEDDVLSRLEALGVSEPWRLAEPLAVAGVDQAWLDQAVEAAGPATGAALRWVAASLTAVRLAAELEESTERMSSLVGVGQVLRVHGSRRPRRGRSARGAGDDDRGARLQAQAHADRARARLRPRHCRKLTVRGSELNQVWTNLLDNAIDALGDNGTITIATRADGECAVVEIADDGPGIPEDVAARVFDPFFTTKDVGQGTGLGLATARRIVVDRHDGSLTLDSVSGRTTFRVRLPFTQRQN